MLYAHEYGVSISNAEYRTLSKTGGSADILLWLHRRIVEKEGEFGKV